MGFGWGYKWPEWPEQQLVDLCCRGTHGNFGPSIDIYGSSHVSMLFTTTEIRQRTRTRTTNSYFEFRGCTPQHSSLTHPHQSDGHPHARTDGSETTTRRGNHMQSDPWPNTFKSLPTFFPYVPKSHPHFPPVPFFQIRACREIIEKVGHIRTRACTLIHACTHTHSSMRGRTQIHFSIHLKDLFETTKQQSYTCAGADTHAGEHNTQKIACTPQPRSSMKPLSQWM